MFFLKLNVEFEDLDPGQVVYHANYLKLCERARNAFLKSKSIDVMELFARNQAFAVYGLQATYLKSLELGEITKALLYPISESDL